SPRPSPVPATAWSVASTARFHRSDPPAFCSSSAGYQSARYQCFCLWSSFLLPTLHRLALDDHLHKTFYTLGRVVTSAICDVTPSPRLCVTRSRHRVSCSLLTPSPRRPRRSFT